MPFTLQTAAAAANSTALAEQNKSRFLSGLMTGITTRSPTANPVGFPPQTTAALLLSAPYVKPLPPLPGVPSIQEYQRKLVAPAALPSADPRLEVLSLLGTSAPQVGGFLLPRNPHPADNVISSVEASPS